METQDSEDVVTTVEHLLCESAELAHAMFRESGIKVHKSQLNPAARGFSVAVACRQPLPFREFSQETKAEIMLGLSGWEERIWFRV